MSVGRYECNKIDAEENLPTLCHVCKHTVDEFLNELFASNSKDILKLGHVLQPEERQKTIVYEKSELRLIEALENTCKNLRNYKVHKDKSNHLRYSKDESATFQTLNELRERGVKVDLGFPDEMWDTPDAEVVRLKTQCENMVEEYEEDLSEWYYNHQDNNLHDWLCRSRVLRGKQKNKDCLQDLSGVKGNEKKNEKIKSKRKAHSGKKVTDKTKGSNENNDISGKNNEFKNGKKNSGLKRNGDELSERDEL